MLTLDTGAILQRAMSRAARVRTWGLAPDLASAMDQAPTQTPAVYIVVSERGQADGGDGFSGHFMQNVAVQVDWVVMVRNYGGAAAVLQEMNATIEQLRAALVGWTPPGCDGPLRHGTRTDQRYASGVLISQEMHTTEYTITRTGDFE